MEKLDKAKITELLKSDFNTKKANAYLAAFFVFVVLLEIFAYFKNGADYIRDNWIAFPIMLVVGVAVYFIFKGFNCAVVRHVEKAIATDNIVVLETSAARVKKGDGLGEVYFSTKHHGKHSVMVDSRTAEETFEKVTRYYLVLTKEKTKYNLALALPSKEWTIDSDLNKYKICE